MRWLLLLAVVGTPLLLSCDGAVHFDNDPAGVDAGVPGGDAGLCVTGACGWEIESCDATSCPLKCQEAANCGGACGLSCSAKCEADSVCTLATAENASVVCEDGARCDFSLGQNGTADCQARATCTIRCVGVCSVQCRTGSTCQLQCKTAAPTTPVGTAACQ